LLRPGHFSTSIGSPACFVVTSAGILQDMHVKHSHRICSACRTEHNVSQQCFVELGTVHEQCIAVCSGGMTVFYILHDLCSLSVPCCARFLFPALLLLSHTGPQM
jgi:ABC-type nickel/cobalt efflux system permease component RcnA